MKSMPDPIATVEKELTADVSEGDLVRRARDGDISAYDDLVKRYQERIYATIYHMTSNHEDASDLAQEAFIKAFSALKSFKGGSSFYTWLYRIAINEALMLVRKRKPQTVSVGESNSFDTDAESEGMEIVDFCCLPEGELLSSESRQFLDRAVQNLPENLRVVFVMRDLEGLSIQETAEALSLSENNIKTRLLRARLRLRQELSVYFGGKMREGNRR